MHFMIDLETLGTESTKPVIAAIGVVAFEIGEPNKNILYTVVNCQSCIDIGMEVEFKAIQWWMKQSDAAREIFNKPATNISTALFQLTNFILANYDGKIDGIWGNGAAFDNVILTQAYRLCNKNIPWQYGDNRCYKTMRELYKNKIKFDYPNDPEQTIKHNALHDAEYQTYNLQKIFKYQNDIETNAKFLEHLTNKT